MNINETHSRHRFILRINQRVDIIEHILIKLDSNWSSYWQSRLNGLTGWLSELCDLHCDKRLT